MLPRDQVGAVLDARDISDRAYRHTRGNIALAFLFNGIGVPLGAFDESRHDVPRERVDRGRERPMSVVEERPFEKRAVRHILSALVSEV